jgi:hypothetical protein
MTSNVRSQIISEVDEVIFKTNEYIIKMKPIGYNICLKFQSTK